MYEELVHIYIQSTVGYHCKYTFAVCSVISKQVSLAHMRPIAFAFGGDVAIVLCSGKTFLRNRPIMGFRELDII